MSELVFDVGYDKDDYIFIPACLYNGNRFDVLKKDYPPMFTPDEAKNITGPVITDVPRLEKDGSGSVEVTTGDAAVPCIGVFSQKKKTGYLLFTVQEIDGKNLGLSYEAGKMMITYPAKRKTVYTWPHMHENEKPYKAQNADIPHKLMEFECDDITGFLKVFFENRKIMGMDDTRPDVLSKEEQLKIQTKKFNKFNWKEKGGFYSVGASDSRYDIWQPGWVGGAMGTYTFLKLGGEKEKERSIKTLYHLFRFQGKSGLFYGGCDKDLNKFSDGFGVRGTDNWCLIRKSADVLYFVLRQFELLENVPEEFEKGIKKCADAFLKIWEENGELGQFIDAETGRIEVPGSASGAIAPAGLVLASRYFKDKKYLEAAEKIGEYYFDNFIKKGYTTGGPGEILQCPDSESAFAALEGYVWLYDETGDEKYLEYAKAAAYLSSSWVVSYNYKFPEKSEFARLNMKTVGSVFANVQNKHSAPGICTLSGTSLRKLYEWTGDKKFLELYGDITETVSQYMSTDKRPVFSHDGKKLPEGFICERVNMSDWETESRVGSVFFGSCWCEVTNLLILAEM